MGAEVIRDDVADLRRYLIELRELLFDQSGAGGGGGKVIDSPAPWNSPVGELLTDIHAGARSLAAQWSTLTGTPEPPTGATDAGTMKGLDFVGTMIERYGRDYPSHRKATEVEVYGWARACRAQLGILRAGEAAWSRAPGGLRCPNEGCGAELWLAPGWQHDPAPGVYCLAEEGEHGGHPSWAYGEWHPVVA
jgi:hypothetical protein